MANARPNQVPPLRRTQSIVQNKLELYCLPISSERERIHRLDINIIFVTEAYFKSVQTDF